MSFWTHDDPDPTPTQYAARLREIAEGDVTELERGCLIRMAESIEALAEVRERLRRREG